jgi:hypothetical protein
MVMGKSVNHLCATLINTVAISLLLVGAATFYGCRKASTLGPAEINALAGIVLVEYDSHPGTFVPLMGATLRLANVVGHTDSSGSFILESVPVGKQSLTITDDGIVTVDTIVLLTESTSRLDLKFVLNRFSGVVCVPNLHPVVGDYGSVQAHLVLDGKHTMDTWLGEPNFDFGYLITGTHSLHVDATDDTDPIDTVFSTSSINDGKTSWYHFYVPGHFRELVFPTVVGTSWEYDYSAASYNSGEDLKVITTGIHNWLVTSRNEDGNSVTAMVMQSRKDSVSESRFSWDTTYCLKDTSYFTIVVTDSIISIGFAWDYPYGINKVPRYFRSNDDTLTVKWTNYSSSEIFEYVSSVGLTRVDRVTTGNNPSLERMNLRGFLRP